jgi:hypothetical protein
MNTEQLEREIFIGGNANKAYLLWVNQYISTQQEILFEEFKQANFQAYASLQARMNAINELERSIKQDIETGKLASKQLKGE